MTKKISIDQLIGEKKEAIVELEIKGEKFEITSVDELPEKFYLRLLKASSDLSILRSEVDSEIAKIDKIIANPKTGIAKIRSLETEKSYLNSKLLTPARESIEAMAKMPSGFLSDIPASTIETLFKEINNTFAEINNPTKTEEETIEGTEEEKK